MVVHVENANALADINEKFAQGLNLHNKIAEEKSILLEQKEEQLKLERKKNLYTSDLGKLGKPELVSLCKQYGVSASGNKPIYIAALTEYCMFSIHPPLIPLLSSLSHHCW